MTNTPVGRALRITVVFLLALGLSTGTLASGKKPSKPAKKPAFGDLDSPLRPGSQATSAAGSCTFNFVFYEPGTAKKAATAYIGTAGHCTDKVGDRVSLGDQGEIGSVVYDSDTANSPIDFTLIKIDKAWVSKTNPAMLGWDGPKGVVGDGELQAGDRVDIYGYGLVVGEAEQTRPRFGFLMAADDEEYLANMPAVNGDSGAPLLHHDTGLALGIISRYGLPPPLGDAVPPTTDQGPLLPWILDTVHDSGFPKLRIATI